MSTSTARVGYVKPITSENVDVTILNANSDKADAVAGTVFASTTTRPSTPFAGQPTFESDTGNLLVHNGSSPASGGWEHVTIPIVSALTQILSPNAGQVVMLSTDGALYKRIAAAWVKYVAGQPISYAASTTTVNNSATLVNATGLVVPVEASAQYAIEACLVYNTGTVPGLKIGWTVPAGATGNWSTGGVVQSANSRIGSADMGVTALSTPLTVTGDASLGVSCRPIGTLTVSSTAGNLQLQVAQSTANVSNTVIQIGSWLKVTRLA